MCECSGQAAEIARCIKCSTGTKKISSVEAIFGSQRPPRWTSFLSVQANSFKLKNCLSARRLLGFHLFSFSLTFLTSLICSLFFWGLFIMSLAPFCLLSPFFVLFFQDQSFSPHLISLYVIISPLC